MWVQKNFLETFSEKKNFFRNVFGQKITFSGKKTFLKRCIRRVEGVDKLLLLLRLRWAKFILKKNVNQKRKRKKKNFNENSKK